jgi:hypothetical protein
MYASAWCRVLMSTTEHLTISLDLMISLHGMLVVF